MMSVDSVFLPHRSVCGIIVQVIKKGGIMDTADIRHLVFELDDKLASFRRSL